jgi:hypothetical protein
LEANCLVSGDGAHMISPSPGCRPYWAQSLSLMLEKPERTRCQSAVAWRSRGDCDDGASWSSVRILLALRSSMLCCPCSWAKATIRAAFGLPGGAAGKARARWRLRGQRGVVWGAGAPQLCGTWLDGVLNTPRNECFGRIPNALQMLHEYFAVFGGSELPDSARF